MQELPIASGLVPIATLCLGWLLLGVLLLGGSRRWWLRRVPAAIVMSVVITGVGVYLTNHFWHPFADPVPGTAVLWIGVTLAALGLAVLHTTWRSRAVSIALTMMIGVCGVLQVNADFGAYPTLASALQTVEPNQVDSSLVLTTTDLAPVGAGAALTETWKPPAGLPTAGKVTSSPIPGTVSGFATDENAWIYLPPAYQTHPRAQLPVLIMLAGQPGGPKNWFDGGELAKTMDAYAAAHHGLAPVVVVPQWLGRSAANPMCVDSASTKDYTYLTKDLPNWIHKHLQVDQNPQAWAVGGLSAGATCAVQLATNDPEQFPTFLDFSGQDHPTLGDHADTVDKLFGGDESRYAAVDPLTLMTKRSYPNSAGVFGVGRDDTYYGPQTRAVYTAAAAAGMNVQLIEVPGGHEFSVWAGLLAASMDWLGTRLGITP